MYIEIWHLWKTYIFLLFRFFIKKINGLAESRWPFLIIIHTLLQIILFPLICVNLRVDYFYRINENMGCFFCRDISNIYSKRFWGNLRIIPQIYKCEDFTETFKSINKLWNINKFFITFSSNMLNPEKIYYLVQRRNFW